MKWGRGETKKKLSFTVLSCSSSGLPITDRMTLNPVLVQNLKAATFGNINIKTMQKT
jgi:hypothetical protein